MSSYSPIPNELLEGMVRAALECEARDVDVLAFERKLADRLKAPKARPPRRSHPKRWIRHSLAAAALLLLGVFVGHWLLDAKPASASASAHAIVSSASAKLPEDRDLCYRIDQLEVPRQWAMIPFLHRGAETTIWTRGDRSRVVTIRDNKELIWGQDEQGRLWGVVHPTLGVIFEPKELPAPFVDALSFANVDVRRLTEELLQDYDLTREPVNPSGVVRIWAKIRHNRNRPHQFTDVELEVEDHTKTIRRMVLTRTVGKTEIARFAFTLLGEDSLPGELYQLSGNLRSGAEILGRSRRVERLRQTKTLLGPASQ